MLDAFSFNLHRQRHLIVNLRYFKHLAIPFAEILTDFKISAHRLIEDKSMLYPVPVFRSVPNMKSEVKDGGHCHPNL